MNTCLFCHSDGPFTRPEHIIPEALGNDDLIQRDEVCDKCNQYFGSKLESFVLGKTPLAFWRTFLVLYYSYFDEYFLVFLPMR